MLLLVRRRGSPHAPAAASCMWACETVWALGDPRACVGLRGLQSRMGVGRGSSVCQARAREHRLPLAPRIGCPGASQSEKMPFVSHLFMPLHRMPINSPTVKMYPKLIKYRDCFLETSNNVS